MAGAQRRIEARIGQLDEVGYHGNHGINNKLIADFRLLARALKDPDVFRIGKEVHDLKPPQV